MRPKQPEEIINLLLKYQLNNTPKSCGEFYSDDQVKALIRNAFFYGDAGGRGRYKFEVQPEIDKLRSRIKELEKLLNTESVL